MMGKACYRTFDDLAAAKQKTKKIINVLSDARESLIFSKAKMPAYWDDSCGEVRQMEIIREIEKLIRELKEE